MVPKMNILYINSHDSGRFISPYGYPVHTPNLQKLAEIGTVFRNAFSAAPTCSPSRAALVTGQYPHCCKILGLGHRGFPMSDYSHHLAYFLREHGYHTVCWGVTDNHTGVRFVGGDAHTCGYETVIEGDVEENKEGFSILSEFLRAPQHQPFFLSISYTLTHRKGEGFGVEPDFKTYDPRYLQPPPILPDTPEIREDWASYLTAIQQLDHQMGQIFQLLKDTGLWDQTLIIATTDHGAPFPRMKCNLTVHGVGVFLILGGIPVFSTGRCIEGMVSQIDIFPTICELAKLPKPDYLQGCSLLPLLQGETEIHDEIFAEVTYHASYEPMRMIRSPRYTYIRRFGKRLRPTLPNIDRSPSKTFCLHHGFADFILDPEMLFDNLYDPQNLHNLAYSPYHQHILNEMRERLDLWMHRTNDPLSQGDVPPPPPPTGWENLREIIHPNSNYHRPLLG